MASISADTAAAIFTPDPSCFASSNLWLESGGCTEPRTTKSPANSYVPPPSHPLTQFTPAPSCLADSNLWIVSTSCYLENQGLERPPWLQCTITEFGEPYLSNSQCYPNWEQKTAGPDGAESFYAACPVGYTNAGKNNTYWLFDSTSYGVATTTTLAHDAFAVYLACCPSGAFDFELNWDVTTSETVHDGTTNTVRLYPMPPCVASQVSLQSGKTATLKMYSDSQVWDRKKKKRQEATDAPTTTAVWDVDHDTVFARVVQYSYFVFHGTYTCYTDCSEYFTSSYDNTDPLAPPHATARPTLTSDDESPTRSQRPTLASTGSVATRDPSAAVVAGAIGTLGRAQGGVALTVVMVTVITLVMGHVV